MKWTVGAKINLGVAVMALLVLLAVGAGYYSANRLADALEFVTTQAWDAADGSMEGTIGLQGEMLVVGDLTAGDISHREAEKSLAEIKSFAAEALSRMKESGLMDPADITTLDAKIAVYYAAQVALLEAHAKTHSGMQHEGMQHEGMQHEGGNGAGMTAAEKGYRDAAHDLLKFLEKVEAAGDGKVEGEVANIAATKSFAENSMILMAVLAILATLATVFMSSRYISAPIVNAAERLQQISQGDGDLRVSLPVKGNDEIASLANNFNIFVEKLRGTIQEIGNLTEQVGSASGEISIVAGETSASVHQQQGKTSEVVTAVDEMSSTVQEVASNATQAATVARDTNDESINGKRVIAEALDAINKLADEMQQAAGVINGLQQETESIGAVLGVIRGIAEQTNLLALNAAIEAARAGENGRGFAVVADEVRTLASRTQQSTQEIDEMITRLQDGAAHAVRSMEVSQQQTHDTVDKVAAAGSSFETIARAIAGISDMTIQISSATEEQSAVAMDISQNLNAINVASEVAAGNAEKNARSSDQLASLAQQLEIAVGQFKV